MPEPSSATVSSIHTSNTHPSAHYTHIQARKGKQEPEKAAAWAAAQAAARTRVLQETAKHKVQCMLPVIGG